jgi:hypothetical protein
MRDADALCSVTLASWVEVFRHSIPTFSKHALSDTAVPEALREVGGRAAKQKRSSADMQPKQAHL